MLPIGSGIKRKQFIALGQTYFAIQTIQQQMTKKIILQIKLITILLKEKINLIIYDVLNNSNPDDDFKVLIINNYIKYL